MWGLGKVGGKKADHEGGNTFFAIQPSTYFYRKHGK